MTVAVVDASNGPPSRKAAAVLVDGSRRLLQAEARAGVRYHVCVSIVGIDEVPMAYYRVKVAQERVVEQAGVPWTIVRATQNAPPTLMRMVEEGRSPAERVVTRELGPEEGIGRPLSPRARQTIRSVEAYLKGGDPPRWMQRLRDIDRGITAERQRLARAHRALARECGQDADLFARRWLALARSWRFDHLNQLIAQHNDWYPIERDLPMDLRTGDYVKIAGRSYRRAPLGPGWVLDQFPASPPPEGRSRER